MSHLVKNLLSGSGLLLRTAALGAALGFSMATQAANVDAPVAQAETFDALVGFTAVPLSVAEADSFDAERIHLRLSFAGVHIGTINMGSRYRGPNFNGNLDCVPVPSPAGGVAVACGLSW